MGELRLICPGCGAEYQLDEGLIPASGREVECSACGRIWRQPASGAAEPPPPAAMPVPAPTHDYRRRDPIDFVVSRRLAGHDKTTPPTGRPAPPAQPAPAPMPRLNRPLPADVLSILTEEAARERAAQAAERSAAPALTPTDWPATTVTITPPRPHAPAAEAAEAAEALLVSPAPSTPVQGAAPLPTTATTEQSHTTAATPQSPARKPADDTDPAAPRHHGRAGFICGLAVAAVLLALYLAAPMVSPESSAGQALHQWREIADHARNWLAGLF
ncbi:MAG: zinc-ribbon domain-containing protein [Paracoccus sp. (in: a-proteobacteria)]|uniref:zinc-ribbon domain-containing protein n=1 Tax=Paracoccus sp. TaxID=267 RepID=UPI0026DFA145|nr:zinc-ribbon domain-containing protein [Paracoccus sp. (in: a-proteobacteria)]MDO5612384.1 zinc-ribbon domain-containing protein [Paracoccus sp. (in: a-proteobacteria)]